MPSQQGDPELVMMLVGNKADLDSRKVTAQAGRDYAGKHEMAFEETSAKTGQNVQKAFTDLLTSKNLHKK